MLNAPFAQIFRRMVSRVRTPNVRSRRTVLEVTQNTLEQRLAPAALAAPIVDSTNMLFQRVGPPSAVISEFINAQTTYNPENPLRQVVVAQEIDNRSGTIDSYIIAKSTIDGGATWSTFSKFGGGAQFTADGAVLRDPTVPGTGDPNFFFFREYSNPSVTITRDAQVYISFRAHNAAQSAGVVGVRRFDFSTAKATPSPVNMDPVPAGGVRPRADGVSSIAYRWGVAGDVAYAPVIGSNPNIQKYTDPDTGTVMDDPTSGTAAGGGQVYLAWSETAVTPGGFGGQWNPGVVVAATMANISAAQAKTNGQYLTAPVRVSGGHLANPSTIASHPQLAFTGNNSVAPVFDPFGNVVAWREAPGMLVTSFENAGTGKFVGTDITDVNGVTIGGVSTKVQPITDAISTGGTPANAKSVTTYNVTVTNTSGIDLTPANFNLANISVSVAIEHPAVDQIRVELLAPDGTAYTLVQNRQDETPNTATAEGNTGITPGLTGADLGYFSGQLIGTTFSDDAPRRISDTTNAAPYIGTFYPDVSGTGGSTGSTLPIAATMRTRFANVARLADAATAVWQIRVTDFVNGPNGPPVPPRNIRMASINLNYAVSAGGGLRQSNFNGSPNSTLSLAGMQVVTPNGKQSVIPLQSAQDFTFPFTPAGLVVPQGIGPGASIALDGSLGANQVDRFGTGPLSNPRAPFAGVNSGLLYVALAGGVDLNSSGDLDANDDTDVFVGVYDTTQLDAAGKPVQLRVVRLNDDKASDNLSQGLRYQYNPALSVDPVTGTLAASWYDARYDAANARFVPMLSTSIDGGATFSPQVSLAQQRVVTDVITGKEVTVEPLPINVNTALFPGQGVGINPIGVTNINGKVSVMFTGNPNAPGGYVYQGSARVAAGPQIVYSDMGAVGNTVATDTSGNSVIQPASIQLDIPIAPTPPRFYQYNTLRAGMNGQPSLAGVADGTPLLDGIRVVFDRRMDSTSFNPEDIKVFYQGPDGSAPIELRQATDINGNLLYPNLTYRIDNLSAQTKGVLINGTGLDNLNSANIITPDTDFVIRFVDATNPTTLIPVGLVGTYSYALSPFIRDRVRNSFASPVLAAGLPTGNVVIPATATPTGNPLDPVTVSYNGPTVILESRRYQQPGGAPTAGPVWAADGSGLTKDLTQLVMPDVIEPITKVLQSPGVTFPSSTGFDGVTDIPINFPSGVFPTGQDKIARAIVQLDLVHTRRGGSPTTGLILQLVSPTGKVIPLSVLNGGNGSSYGGSDTNLADRTGFAFENTVFDSQSGLALEAGGNRYQGAFRPVGRFPTLSTGVIFPTLHDLSGDSPTGTWTLRIIDNFNQDNQYGETGPNPLGYLRNWSVTIVPGSISTNPFGTTAAEIRNSPRRGNFLDSDGDASAWEPVQDSYQAPRSTAAYTLTGGPYQVDPVSTKLNGRGLFEIGPFDKATLPLVIGGPRVLGVATRVDDANKATTDDGRNLNDQVYVNRPADNLYVRFDRAVNVGSINPDGIRIIGPGGPVAGPFTVTAGATADEVVLGFASTAGGSFTRGGSYTVQFDANITSTVGDKVDVNQNAGVDRLFGGNATTSAIQTVTFGSSGGPVTIRSAPVQAFAGGQAVTGETVAELPIPVSQAFQIAQDLARYPNSRLQLSLQIRDTQNLAPGEVSRLFQSLTADLVAPDGTRIKLFTGLGNALTGPGTVSTNIVFDDAALSPIGAGVNPFQTAPYNPQIPLSRLLGKWSLGTWKVVVTNNLFRIDPNTLLAVDVGQIVSASLTLTKAAVQTGLGEARADETTLGFRVFNQDPTSKESGQVWQAVGAAPTNNQANVGRVSAVTIDPADPTGNTVFAAGASGGVWKTTNFLTNDPDGPSWVPLTDFGPTTALNVASIAVFPRVNPVNPAAGFDPAFSVVFAQTGEGNSVNLPNGNTPWTKPGVGVLRSFDGGRTWTLLDSTTNSVTAANARPGETVGTVLDVADSRRDHFFVGASGFKVIVDPTPYQTLAGDPNRTSPNNLAVYMAVSDSRPTGDPNFAGGVWRSLDSGRTWTRIGWGNATDVAFAPGAIGPDGNIQTLYLALLTAPGVTGGVYITRQATNVPAAPANSIGALTYLLGGGGNNVIRNQISGANTAVGVTLQFGPFVSPTRITLAAPATTNNPLANNIYQGWLYALASNSDGSVDGLYVTKDFGSNWTDVRLPELRDAAGDFWGHNDEFLAQVPKNSVTFDVPTQFTGNVAYTRDAALLGNSPRTYIPRPGAGTSYGTTPRATGQGTPGTNGTGGTGNRALSLAVDPLNPAVVFLGGDRSVRVDTSIIKDAQSFFYFENTDNFPLTLLASKSAGGVTMPQQPDTKGLPLENANPPVGGSPWGVIVPGSASPTDTANGQAAVYRDKYGIPTGYINLSKDPGNPFLNPSVIQVYNAGTFTNTGENAALRPFDNILFGSYDVTAIVPFVDPQTGKTRLIYGTANGIYTGVDTANQSGPTLDVAIGDSTAVANPTQVARIITGPRNGNLQIGQYYQGAVQSSRLAADIAGALFYATSQDNGYPVSNDDVIETGNTAQRTNDWPGTGLNVAVDPTGTGTAYQYRLPSSTGTDSTNTNFGDPTDFFRLQLPGSDQAASGIGRTNNLLTGQNPFLNQGDWPLNDTRYGEFTINPVDGAGIAISAAPLTAGTGGTARVFRTIDRGLTWQDLGAPAGVGQYVSSLAFGGPDKNFPTQRNNYILAGTGDSNANGYATGGSNGQVYFTVNGTLNSWVRVPGDAATGGRSIQKIVPNPRFGTSDFYVMTDRDVFYVTMNLDRTNPTAVTAVWTNLTNNLYSITRTMDSFVAGADGKVQSTVALRDTAGRQLDLTALAVDWRYTNPVLYVAGEGGTVFRTVTFNPAVVDPVNGNPVSNRANWTSFPDNPNGSYADGGFLPSARITDLDLSIGSIEQNYDPANPGRGGMPILGIDPGTGLPRSGGTLNLLVATTYGRGQFVTRINPADPALNPPNDPVRSDAFVSGPRVSTIANPNPVNGPSTTLTVVFDAPVDPVTLDPSDITLLDTGGSPVTVTSVTPVPAIPGQPDPRNRYILTFSKQDVEGFYYLQVGNSKDLRISDLAGNRMNQNANLLNGETFTSPNGDDTYTTFVYLNGRANSLLVTGLPSKLSTSAPAAFTVTATQADGTVDNGFGGTVTLTSSDPNVLLSSSSGPGVIPSQSQPVSYTFTGTDAGRHAFTLTFRSGAAITNPDGTLIAPVSDLVGLFQTVRVDVDAISAATYNPGQVGASVYNARVELTPASLPAAVSTWDPQDTIANVVDYNGNRLPAFGGTIGLTSTDGNVLLPPPQVYVAGASNGAAAFDPIIFRTKGTQSLTYTGLPVDGVDPLTVKTAVSNAVLDVTGFATDGSGKLITSTYDPQSLTVTVRSALDGKALPAFNLVTGPQARVSVVTDDPQADVTPPIILYPLGSNGAGPTEVMFRTPGTPTRQVTFSVPIGVDTKTITPTVVAADFEVLNADGTTFQPAVLSTWNPQSLTVNVISPVTGKVLPRFTGDVTVSSSDPLAAAVQPDSDPANKLAPLSPSGQKYTYTPASAGTEVQTLLFRTGSTLSTGGTNQSFTFDTPLGVNAKTVTTKVVNAVFNVSGLPNPLASESAIAGVGLNVGVAISDPLNKNATLPAFVGTVTLGTDDTKASLTPNPFTYTASNNGNKAFVATYRTSGAKTFTANTPIGVDPYGTLVLVDAAEASKLVVGGYASPVVAGTTDDYTVTLFDQFGNVATGYTGTVRLSTSDAQAGGLPLIYTFTAANAGQATFTATMKTAGTQQIVASEQGGLGMSASQTGIVVTPAAATQFTLFGYPAQTTAGDPHPLILKASDPFGNTATDFIGTVTFTSSDSRVTAGDGLPTAYPFTAADLGQKVFQGVELRTAGVQSITATSGAISSTQSGITVFAAPASTFDFGITSPSGPPYTVPSGGQVGYQVVARDRFGNIDTKYAGTVQFTSTDPQASLPGAYPFTQNDGGQKGFASFLYTSGTQTITARDPISGAVGSSPSIVVQPAAAGLLNVAGFPSTLIAGDTGGFSVTLFDNKGNVATGFTGTIAFSSSDPTVTFALASAPGTPITSYTFSTSDSGTRQFVARLTKAGLQTLTVTPVTDPAVNSGTVSTTVQASAVTGFTVSDFPTPVDAGTPRLVRVTARDKFGNQADNYAGLVRLTSSDPAAVLPSQSKLTGGTAFFLVTLNTAGTQTITASDTLNPAVLGSQSGIQVNGVVVNPQPKPPTVTDIPSTSVITGQTVVQSFAVVTYPLGADANGLVYTATSSNPVLLPQTGLVFGGSGTNRTLAVTPASGLTGTVTVTVTVTDPTTNLFTTDTFDLTVNPVPLPPVPPPGSQTNLLAVGSDIGVVNRVSVYNPDGSTLNTLEPFAAGFTFGTRVATVRQANGKQLIAAVPGPGRQTEVRLIDPTSGATVTTLAGFESSFTGGAFVAAGDVNADGYEDIAISPDQGGGGRVRLYDGRTFNQLADFYGIDDPNFRGGARVSFGDMNADGRADLVVSAGFGGGPRIALFSGATVIDGRVPEKFVGDFYAFEESLRNGAYVAAGDLNGDGAADLFVAGGPGGGPRVRVVDGRKLLAAPPRTLDDPSAAGLQIANFFAGNPDSRGGTRITVKNLDGDRFADLVAGDGEKAGTRVRTYFGADIIKSPDAPVIGAEFEELPGANNGVYVG